MKRSAIVWLLLLLLLVLSKHLLDWCHEVSQALAMLLGWYDLPFENKIPIESASQLGRGGYVTKVVKADYINHRRHD